MTDHDRIAAIVRRAEANCCTVTVDEIRWLADRAALPLTVGCPGCAGALAGLVDTICDTCRAAALAALAPSAPRCDGCKEPTDAADLVHLADADLCRRCAATTDKDWKETLPS